MNILWPYAFFLWQLTQSCFVSDTSGELGELRRLASARYRAALRPGTRRNLHHQYKAYLTFCCHYGLPDMPASPSVLILYMEFLTGRVASPATIHNYLSGVHSLHLQANADTAAFSDFRVKRFLKAVQVSVRHVPTQKAPVTHEILGRIAAVCPLFSSGRVLKCLLFWAFYSFARLSSLLPASPTAFDISRHATRGDVALAHDCLRFTIKWSKTQQAAAQRFEIPMLLHQTGSFCPVQAFLNMVSVYPTLSKQQPLFPNPTACPLPGPTFPSLDMPTARAWLARALSAAGFHSKSFSFHSLRRGGCSAAYGAGASTSDLMFHGGWKSAAVLSQNAPTPS